MAPLTLAEVQQLSQLHGLPFWVALLIGFGGPIVVAVLGLMSKRVTSESLHDQAIAAQSSQLINLMQAELQRTYSTLSAFQPQLETLAKARFELLDVVIEVYSAAIAARTMVHDLERQLGRPETTFPPLPEVPLKSSSSTAV